MNQVRKQNPDEQQILKIKCQNILYSAKKKLKCVSHLLESYLGNKAR